MLRHAGHLHRCAGWQVQERRGRDVPACAVGVDVGAWCGFWGAPLQAHCRALRLVACGTRGATACSKGSDTRTAAPLQTFIDSLMALRGGSGAAAAAALAGRRGHGFGAAVAALGLSNKAVFEGDVAEGGGNAGALGICFAERGGGAAGLLGSMLCGMGSVRGRRGCGMWWRLLGTWVSLMSRVCLAAWRRCARRMHLG